MQACAFFAVLVRSIAAALAPAAVVEVIRDGKVVLSKGYGLADIEQGVPMGPETVFAIGSNSKQFTAMSIYLLAQDGKLSLDDDIRRYLPEMPDFGKTITLRHLLHHTSGLRDYFELMFLEGARPDDVIASQGALTLAERQRTLNFAPGAEHMYSNTGYLLLAQIVERVSGKPLAVFAHERIFAPLGMTHTRFRQGYGTLAPHRALSYARSGSGAYEYVAVAEAIDGAGGVVSTAGDLALWDRNFYDGRVGGLALLAQMQAVGVLNDGTRLDYASGLVVKTYRGKRTVEHGGAIGGFRAQLARFPDQRFSVVVLGNASDLDLDRMVAGIIDIFLDPDTVTPPPPEPMPKVFKEIAVDPARLHALVGYYAMSPEAGVDFTEEHGHLTAKGNGLPRLPVFAYGERDFFAKAIDAQFSFDPPGADGMVAGGVLHQGGRDTPAKRVARPVHSQAELQRYAGDFYSDELHLVYSVAVKNGGLVLTYPRGTAELDNIGNGTFGAGFPFGAIEYQCGGPASCAAFTVNSGRIRGLAFRRISLVATP